MTRKKIEIKNSWTGSVLFEFEKEGNTIKDTLIEAIKQGVDLRYAELTVADLRYAELTVADLEGADLRGTDLRGADLRRANLRGADLEGANLRGANLEGADLRYADLRRANLRGADLEGAYLYMWDGDNVNLEEIIENVEESSNLKIKKYYTNKHILSPVTKIYWENGLIIDEYEITK